MPALHATPPSATLPLVTQFSVFRFPSAGYIKISSRTVLFLCPYPLLLLRYHLFQCATVYCSSFLQCLLLLLGFPLSPSYPPSGRAKSVGRANKSCAQSVDINFVSLLFRAKLLTDNAQEQCAIIIPFSERELLEVGEVCFWVSAVAKNPPLNADNYSGNFTSYVCCGSVQLM